MNIYRLTGVTLAVLWLLAVAVVAVATVGTELRPEDCAKLIARGFGLCTSGGEL